MCKPALAMADASNDLECKDSGVDAGMSIQPHLHMCNPALYDSNDLECKDSLCLCVNCCLHSRSVGIYKADYTCKLVV